MKKFFLMKTNACLFQLTNSTFQLSIIPIKHKRIKAAGAILFAVGMIIWGTTVSAQKRITDLEAVSISPVGTIVNGQSLILRFGYVNHGPDKGIPGDSTFYSLSQRYEDGTEKNVYQGLMIINGVLDSGETATYKDNYSIAFNIPNLKEPLTMDFCVSLYTDVTLTNGTPINLSHHDPNLSNNTSCQKVTILPNPIVTISELPISAEFSLYPNPAQNKLNLKLPVGLQKEGIIIINDELGRQVFQQNYDIKELHEGTLSFNIAFLPTGLYFVSVKGSTQTLVKKLRIAR